MTGDGDAGGVGCVAVQATVRRFDGATCTGDALRDDGVVVAFGAAAFRAGGLLLLRPGQRVELFLRGAEVTRVALAG